MHINEWPSTVLYIISFLVFYPGYFCGEGGEINDYSIFPVYTAIIESLYSNNSEFTQKVTFKGAVRRPRN